MSDKIIDKEAERWRLALEGSDVGIFDWDVKTGYCYYSERWKGMIGYSDEEIKNELAEWEKLVHPDDLTKSMEQVNQHLLGKSDQYVSEFRMKCKNGEYKWLAARGKVVERNEKGEPLRVVGTHTDINDKKKLEKEVVYSKILMQAAFDQSPIPMAVITFPDFSFKIINKAAEELLLINATEYVGKKIEEIKITWKDLSPEGTPIGMYDLPMPKAIQGISTKDMEILLERHDGTRRWELTSAAPIYDEEGVIIGGILVMLDNTERKKVMEEIKAAKQEAEAASLAKSQFLANMSHEIRTPMNGIVGMGELLSIAELKPEHQVFVESINISANNLLGIINDILDISKIEAGKIEVETREFEVEKLLDSVLSSTMFSAHKKNLEIVCDVDREIPEFLEGDDGKIRQILLNLVSNAIKFTEKGNVFVEIKKIAESADNVEIRFTVSDTGIGMLEGVQKNLFQPFVQGDLTYTKKYQGTGLGLAISKRLVEIMGGEIGYETQENIGSKFYFQVPVKISKKQTHNVRSLEFNFNKMSVLVIDDNELNRTMTSKMLNEEGATVYLAENGYKGIEMLQSNIKVDLILLDVHMPVLDGFQTAEMIRKMFENKYTILMFTSVDIRDNLEKIKTIGVSDYLIKPVRRKELFYKIRETVNSRAADQIEEDIQEIQKCNKIKVLVAEDNYINLQTIVQMVKMCGDYEIIQAQNGKEAVEKYQETKAEFIFLDLQMPIMNGFEALEEIKKIAFEEKKKPIITAVTAYVTKADEDKCIKSGMDYFIAKPYRIGSLKKILELELKK